MPEKLVVLGAGESGVGAALLGQKQGFEVFVSDFGALISQAKETLTQAGIQWEENGHDTNRILTADLVIKSPGIAEKTAIVKAIRTNEIPLISEVEFAARYTTAKLIAVTGSNGKTTVVSWIANILKNAEANYILAGNIGDSFAKSVAFDNHPEYYVLEVSSFQLDDIVDFHPYIAVITNITPDHLDRYNYDFQQYIDAKFKITKNQTQQDYFIYDADDEVIKQQLELKSIKVNKIPLSFKKLNGLGTTIMDDKMITLLKGRTFDMNSKEFGLKGDHNAKNAMAASTVANLLNIRKDTIRRSLQGFQGVEHRLEPVMKVKNVQYINDSKATNINSTFYALKTVRPKTIWIVGGVDKGNDYSELLPLVNEKVKAIICLGINNSKIIDSFDNCVDTLVEARSMNEAVQMAYHLAEDGDTVLLSPACASFDLFKNYEDRGRQFKAAVSNL